MPNILIVGATRGLGASLAKSYASDTNNHVYATARTSNPPPNSLFTLSRRPNIVHDRDIALVPSKNLIYVPSIDISSHDVGNNLLAFLHSRKVSHLDLVIITAGFFETESLKEPSFSAQEKMYRTCAIGPTILVTSLANDSESLLDKNSKVIFVSSESGSITLRHESEGGGNYGHHASKTALNMCAKLLSLDLKERGVAIAAVHPGFMRTEMTKGVGFDKYYDAGGAVTPDVAAKSLADWIETFDISKTGEYWAPRGPGDIGTAEPVLGSKEKLSTPLQLPW